MIRSRKKRKYEVVICEGYSGPVFRVIEAGASSCKTIYAWGTKEKMQRYADKINFRLGWREGDPGWRNTL